MSALLTASPLVTDPSLLVLLDDLEQAGAITPTALKIDRDIDYDTAVALGRFLGSLTSASKFWLGDLLLYASRSFGETWAQIAHETGRSVGTLQNYLWVAEKIDPKRRREDLSWTHHEVVAALAPREQRTYLARAARESLSSDELRQVIRIDRTLEGDEEDSPGAEKTSKGQSKDEVRQAAAAVWHQAQRDGDSAFYLVPVDVMARLGAALGYH